MERARSQVLRSAKGAGAVGSLAALAALAAFAGDAARPSPAFGQSKVGTTFGQFLKIEPSSRFAGMGNAGTAFFDGLDAAYYNPAAVVGKGEKEAQFTHSEWFAGIGYNYAAAAVPIQKLGTFYASATVLSSGDIAVRTVTQPLGTGELYHVTNVAVGLGYGHAFGDRLAVGLSANYVQETIWNSSAHAWTLNLGTLYRVSANGLSIGASLLNFGTDAQYDGDDLRITYDQDPDAGGDNSTLPADKFTGSYNVPVLFRVGLSYPYQLNQNTRVNVAVDAFHANDNFESVSPGAEMLFKDRFAVRAGWQNLFLDDGEMGATLGAGLNGRFQEVRYRFDYAWADYGRIGDAHRLTLGVEF